MLKLAYDYEIQLNRQIANIAFGDKYKFYNDSQQWDYNIGIDKDSWDRLQMVSVNKNDEVIGYMDAQISRVNGYVASLGIVNFYDNNICFSRDLRKFLINLFEVHNFKKISFEVIVGNPIEKMYDRVIKKYGGRIVGVKKKHQKLYDNKYYDMKMYEIFKEDYEKNK